jgi:sugar lactone lactonase YvrE
MVALAQPTNTSAAAIGRIARMFHPRGKKKATLALPMNCPKHAIHRAHGKILRSKETKWIDPSLS